MSAGTRPPAGPDHVPIRLSWLCASCGQDWPCPSARARLADEYCREPISTGMYLCVQMHQAIVDLHQPPLPGLTAAGFYARFLAWVRPDC